MFVNIITCCITYVSLLQGIEVYATGECTQVVGSLCTIVLGNKARHDISSFQQK